MEQAGLGCAAGGLELCGWSLAGPEGGGKCLVNFGLPQKNSEVNLKEARISSGLVAASEAN